MAQLILSTALMTNLMNYSVNEYSEFQSNEIARVVTNLARHFFFYDPTDVTLIWTRMDDFTGLRDAFVREFTNINNNNISLPDIRYDGPFAVQVNSLDINAVGGFERFMRCLMGTKSKTLPLPRIINLFILVDSINFPMSSLEKQTILLAGFNNWQPKAKVIIFWPWEIPMKDLYYALKILARYHITKILLVVKSYNENKFRLFSWDDHYEIKNYRCAEKASSNIKEFAQLYLNGTYKRIDNSKRFSLKYLSLRNLPSNMHECICLVGSTLNEPPYIFNLQKKNLGNTVYDGIEIRLMELVANYYHFKINFSLIFQNDVSTFMTSKVDIILGGVIPASPCMENLVDISFPYTQDYLVWFIRKKPVILNWIVLVDAFEYQIWRYVLIFMLSGALVIFISSWIGHKHANKKWNFNQVFWYTIYLFLGQPGINLARHSISFWLIAFVYMYGQLLINTFYQTALYDELTKVNTIQGFNSEKEIMASRELTRMATFNLMQFKYPMNKFQFPGKMLSDIPYFLNEIFNNNTAVISSGLKTSHFLWPNYFENGAPLIIPIDERLITYQVSINLESGSIFYKALNTAIIRLVESGIVEYWRMDLLKGTQKAAVDRKQSRLVSKTAIYGMGLDNFQAVLIFWCLGLLVSILIFFCEHFFIHLFRDSSTKKRDKFIN